MTAASAQCRIRRATAVDAAHIAAHRARMFLDMKLLDSPAAEAIQQACEPWIHGLLQDRSYVGWLILDADTVVGGGGLHLSNYGPKPGFPQGGTAAHVANVYVAATHRRRGLAEAVMRTMVQWAREHGIGEMTLTASEQGRALYQRLGFVSDPAFHLLKV